MKKNYLLLLFVFSLTIVASAQQTLYSDDFETGYTNDADLVGVNGWQVFGTTPIVKSVQNAGAGFNGSDWYIEISTGAFQQIQKVYELVSGETYEFKIQAIRTNGFNGELKVQAFKLGGTTTLITESPAAITNDAYQEKSITFVADESINHGFRITQNFGTSFMQIDDVQIVCTSCSPPSGPTLPNNVTFNKADGYLDGGVNLGDATQNFSTPAWATQNTTAYTTFGTAGYASVGQNFPHLYGLC